MSRWVSAVWDLCCYQSQKASSGIVKVWLGSRALASLSTLISSVFHPSHERRIHATNQALLFPSLCFILMPSCLLRVDPAMRLCINRQLLRRKNPSLNNPPSLRSRLLLLLLPERGETDAGDLHDLEPYTGNITFRFTLTTKSSEEDLVVLVDEVETAVIRYYGRNSLVRISHPAKANAPTLHYR